MGFPSVASVKSLPASAGDVRDLGFIAMDRGPQAIVHRVAKSWSHTHT